MCRLLEHGLLRKSFVPPREIRELRDLTRYRKALIRERTSEVNRLHKVLEDAGVKLATVASDVMGVSGRRMLEALVAGTTDPEVLADLAKTRLRTKLPELRKALDSRFREHHGFLVSQILAHVDYLDEAIGVVSGRLDEALVPFQPAITVLLSIPGIQRRTAEVVIAEIGTDMSRFPTSRHLASWAGLCPGQQRERRQTQTRTHDQRQPMAADRAGRGGARSDPPERLPAREVLASPRPTRTPASRDRGRARACSKSSTSS